MFAPPLKHVFRRLPTPEIFLALRPWFQYLVSLRHFRAKNRNFQNLYPGAEGNFRCFARKCPKLTKFRQERLQKELEISDFEISDCLTENFDTGLEILNALYEMLMGFTPFYGEPAPMGTYKKIVNDSCKIQISRRFKERPYVKSLITSLLQRDWTKRIGILQNGVFDIVHHEFFGGMARERDDHWMRTLRKEYKSEYVPHVVDSFDSSLFQDI